MSADDASKRFHEHVHAMERGPGFVLCAAGRDGGVAPPSTPQHEPAPQPPARRPNALVRWLVGEILWCGDMLVVHGADRAGRALGRIAMRLDPMEPR